MKNSKLDSVIIQISCHATNKGRIQVEIGDDCENIGLSQALYDLANYEGYCDVIKKEYDGLEKIHSTFIAQQRGFIFGHGAQSQSNEIVELVDKNIKQNSGKKIIVNLYGHSRGAIVALLAIKKLARIKNEPIEVNVSLCDPVPGNYHFTKAVDVMAYSLVNKSIDCSECSFVKKVVVFITAAGESLQNWAHTPILPYFHNDAVKSLYLITGRHSSSENVLYTGNMFIFSTPSLFIFEQTKDIFQYNYNSDLIIKPEEYQIISNDYQRDIIDCDTYLKRALDRESKKYRTVYTKNGFITLIPEESSLNIDGSYYKRFNIKATHPQKDTYIFDYHKNGCSVDDHLFEIFKNAIANVTSDKAKALRILDADNLQDL